MTQRPTPRELVLDDQLCFALYTASRALTRAYAPLLEPLGLTYPQYLVMLALWQDLDAEPTVGTLVARLHLDTGTLTPLLKRLQNLGLIERRRDSADERRVLIALTEQGKALRDKAVGIPREVGRRMKLTLPQAVALRQELVRLAAALDPAIAATTASSTAAGR